MKNVVKTLLCLLLGPVCLVNAQNQIGSTGNVGINTLSPNYPLDVRGDIYTNGMLYVDGGDVCIARSWNPYGYVVRPNTPGLKNLAFAVSGGGSLDNLQLNANTCYVVGNMGVGTSSPLAKADIYWPGSSNPQNLLLLHSGSFMTAANATSSYFVKMMDDGNNTTKFIVRGDGTVGIGTDNPGSYQLAVEGVIGARKVKVTQQNPWPDYVFNKGYVLTPIDSLAQYIRSNGHLPEMPAAAEVAKNGLDLGDNQALLLKKIEELTLYMIALKKENEEMKKENAEMRSRIIELSNKVDSSK